MKKLLKYGIFYSLLAVMLLPAIQTAFHPFREKPLNGDFTLASRPEYSWKAWFGSSFQGPFEQYLKDQGGFRASFIRLLNEVDFTLFRKPNAEGVVVGKEDYLYEYDYIRAWTGQDFVGEDFIRKKMARARYVADYLKREKNIDLILVFEPGKASFYPEYIPGKYLSQSKGPSNLDTYLRIAREMGVACTDLNGYFLGLKNHSAYPLFPRYGTHWSEYGMSLAADTLVRFIEAVRKIDLPPLKIRSLEKDIVPRSTDDDVLRTMNLMFRRTSDTLAYPVYDFDTLGTYDRPKVLAVADSYYWNIFNSGIPKNLFGNLAFWYFNARVYPDFYYRPTVTGDLDLKKEIDDQDVILLMVTERFMYKFDWGFIDQLYAIYAPPELADPVYTNITKILNYSPWFEKVIEKSGKDSLPLGESLRREALFQLYENDRPSYFVRYGREHFTRIIREDSAWYAHVARKAEEKGIPADEMLATDAVFMFHEKYPDLFEINTGIRDELERTRKDPARLAVLIREADSLGWDREDYLYLAAEHTYTDQRIQSIIAAIRSDNKWLTHVKDKAAAKKIPLDEMLILDARYVYDQKRHPVGI